MKLVETHIINANHRSFKFFDEKMILSKNLYNVAIQYINEIYQSEKRYVNYYEVNRVFIDRNVVEYRALSANVSQQVLMQVDRCWKSYFKALREYNLHPNKFKAKPNPPKQKDKIWQRNCLTYTRNVISQAALKNELIILNSEDSLIRTRLKSVSQVKVVKLNEQKIKVLLIYDKQADKKISSDVYAGCDVGVSNLLTVCFNDKSIKPVIISGGPLKSINQYYHKQVSKARSKLKNGTKSSKRIRKLGYKHNMKIYDYIHKSSRAVVKMLNENNVSKIVIGYNPEWKQHVSLGRKNNQNFVSIPFLKEINAVAYKCELAGIEVVIREESYTSKCSFLDMEKIRKREKYVGKRIRRGLFQAADGRIINADLNAAYNILKKEVPNAFANGIEGVAVRPFRILLQ
jgi:IS605 OrfB family transposase